MRPSSGLLRHEDLNLVRGAERYVGDIKIDGQISMAVVRSPIAHGTVLEIDKSEAQELAGVFGVFTADDIAGDLGQIPSIRSRLSAGFEVGGWLQPVIASKRVRFVGEPLAIVLAEDRYVAEDAAELVFADVEPTTAVVDIRSAAGAEPLFEGGNQVFEKRAGFGDPGRVFAEAPVVVEAEVRVGRHTAMPIETRGVVVDRRPDGSLVVYGATKVPHWNRDLLAEQLGMPPESITMRETAVGGGFGVRGEFYPEDFLVPWAARKLGRPVAWIEDRREHFLATNHAREQFHKAAIAGDEEGRILAMRSEFWVDLGAYVRTNGARAPEVTAAVMPGPYDIANYEALVHAVVTNRTPTGTFRGPGRVEACYVCEHLIDLYASRIEVDPIAVRRRNLITPGQMPYERRTFDDQPPASFTEGDYPSMLERVLERIDMDEVQRRKAAGEKVGVGLGLFIESPRLGPWESGAVELSAEGRVSVRSGATSVGQGMRTALAQVAARCFDMDASAVEVALLDTSRTQKGWGSFASRTTATAGSAVHLAASSVVDKAKEIAAREMNVAPDTLSVEGGGLRTADGGMRMSFADIAGMEASRGGISAEEVFTTDVTMYDFGADAAVVSVDPATGAVTVEDLVLGFDAGRVINRKVAEGQLVGAAMQGLGGALLENLVFDDEGNPLVTSFMDYLMPTTAEAPRFQPLLFEDEPALSNPLGVKGVGEGGIIGVVAAIASAAGHAVGRAGIVDETPIDFHRLLVELQANCS